MEKSYYVEKESTSLSDTGVELTKSISRKKYKCLALAHLHRAIEMLIIQNGVFEIEADGDRTIVRKGDLVLFRPNTIHRVLSLEDGETGYLVFKIKPELFLDFAQKDKGVLYLFQLSYRKSKYIWTYDETKSMGILPVIERCFHECDTKPYATELSVKANTVLLLTALLRNEIENFPNVETVSVSALHKIYSAINIINSRYDENITAAECALAVNMSYTHFSRRFKAVTGKSFTRYLNEVRVNYAEKELLLTDKSVTDVAYASGFNDVSYFIATYKKLRGKTPYKSKNKKEE